MPRYIKNTMLLSFDIKFIRCVYETRRKSQDMQHVTVVPIHDSNILISVYKLVSGEISPAI